MKNSFFFCNDWESSDLKSDFGLEGSSFPLFVIEYKNEFAGKQNNEKKCRK